MRCESGSVKRGGNEIGCASSESGAQPIDLLSYDGCFRGSRGQVGCHLRSSLESLGWDFERAVSPSTPSSDRCRRGRSGFFLYARDICFTASSLLEYFPGACATDVHAIPSIQPDWGPRLKLEIIVKTPLRPACNKSFCIRSNAD